MDINILAFLLLAFTLIISSLNRLSSQIPLYSDDQIQKQFKIWKEQFSMKFSDQQGRFRFEIFASNMQKIKEHNSFQARTYDLGLNQFAHLTEQQFHELFLTNTQILQNHLKYENIDRDFINVGNLTDVDWQNLGKVSEIKNQGNCNAGYAFSTTSLIETSLMMENQDILLSQQSIIDCSNYQTFGCDGGSRWAALNFVQLKGISTQKQYPYTGTKGFCKIQQGSITPDFTVIQSKGCDQMKQNLYKSPLTVAVNAKNWQLYSTGVFNNCPFTSQVNHEIYLVGVTLVYWRLKNSWGPHWGQSGYIRVKLGNNCGICETPGYGFTL